MSCEGIAYPYLELPTGLHKWQGRVSPGVLCTSLFVSSNMTEVPIEVSPPDDDGDSDGLTDFCRQYSQTAPVVVTLTAPEEFDDDPPLEPVPFTRWYVDNVAQPIGERVTQVNIDGSECHEARAHYGTISVSAVCNGVLELPHVAQVSAQYSAGIRQGINCADSPIEFPCGCLRSWRNCSNSIWAAQGGRCSARIVVEGQPVWNKTKIHCDCDIGHCNCQMPCSPICVFHTRGGCWEADLCSYPANDVIAPSGHNCHVRILSCGCDTVNDMVRVEIEAGFTAAACWFMDFHIYACIWCAEPGPSACCPSPWCAAGGASITVKRHLVQEAPFDGTQEGCDEVVQSMFDPGARWESEQWVEGRGDENTYVITETKQITVTF